MPVGAEPEKVVIRLRPFQARAPHRTSCFVCGNGFIRDAPCLRIQYPGVPWAQGYACQEGHDKSSIAGAFLPFLKRLAADYRRRSLVFVLVSWDERHELNVSVEYGVDQRKNDYVQELVRHLINGTLVPVAREPSA